MSFVKEIRIHTARLGENQQESEPTIKVIKNPHKNTKHVIEYYKWLATDAPIEELCAFADDRYLNDKYPLLMNRYDLYRLETAGLNIEVPEDEIPELIELAQDSFFSGMREDNKVCLNILDIYAIAKTEVRAFRELPDSDTTVLKWFWLYQEDFIDLYNSLGFKSIIADVYDIKGYKWFCEEAWNDPVRYKWALNAILAKKHCSKDETEKVREDLFNLYENILLSAANFQDNSKMNNVLRPIKEAIKHWDNKKIELAITELNKLKEINLQLTNDYETVKKKFSILQKQVRNLQVSNKSADEKLDEIIFRIYCVTQTNISDEKFKAKFATIWNKLSDQSKEDIYSSITLFNSFEAFDLALLPLIRSLEREFYLHYFEPFIRSIKYKQGINNFCNNNIYYTTHNSLLAKRGPTIGNIPFIGQAINDANAIKSSEVIKAFGEFLGKNKKVFSDICEQLNSYRIGIRKYRLVDVRNGIAHGDGEVIQNIDKCSYEEISKMFYEPPIQILFRLIENSTKY